MTRAGGHRDCVSGISARERECWRSLWRLGRGRKEVGGGGGWGAESQGEGAGCCAEGEARPCCRGPGESAMTSAHSTAVALADIIVEMLLARICYRLHALVLVLTTGILTVCTKPRPSEHEPPNPNATPFPERLAVLQLHAPPKHILRLLDLPSLFVRSCQREPRL